MKKKIIVGVVLLLIVGLLILISYREKEYYDGNIVSVEYRYGSYNGGYWDYKIYTEDNKTYILASGMNGVDLNLNKEINASVLSDISKIVKDNEIYEWNGFNENDNNILDGYSFSLTIKYSDGKEVKASGYMKYPANYENGHEELSGYLESINMKK